MSGKLKAKVYDKKTGEQMFLDGLAENTFMEDGESVEVKVNQLEEVFEEAMSLRLMSDLDNTDYKTNDFVDIEKIRTLQVVQYGTFFRKLRKKEMVQICCMGDSLTNGQDTVSPDIRSVTEDATRVSGEPMSSHTIASVTYPEALRNYLRNTFGTQVSVINRGYSGDWVQAGYERYNMYHSSDLSILMYGTNDSRASWIPSDIVGSVEKYIEWYEQLIIREILWGKAVIIIKSPKLPNASDLDIDTFRNALDLLGEKYCVPVIDGEEFMKNYDMSIYSDAVHFNNIGYSILGFKIASCLISENLQKPLKVKDGSKVLTRPTIDNIVYCGTSYFGTRSSAGTPNETGNEGISARIPVDQCVVYSVYTDVDDLVVLPYAGVSTQTGGFYIELDFGKPQPQNSLDGAIYLDNTTSESNETYLYYTGNTYYSKDSILKSKLPVIRIVNKGWHIIKITAKDATVALEGLEFMSYENYKQNNEKEFYYGLSHETYSATPSQITEITLNKEELLKNLKLKSYYHDREYWRNMPLKITVFNYGQSIIEYILLLGSLVDGTNSYFAEYSRKNLTTTPTETIITSATVDATTITLNIGGENRVFSYNIQLM